MEKTIIIYWSGTGNTETMAEKILAGLNSDKVIAKMVPVFEISAKEAHSYDKIILGCPAMGLEQLEAEEFEPFFEELETMLTNKKVALFGSYGWGGGEWMTAWEKRVKDSGAILFEKSLTIASTPSSEEENDCIAFGESLKTF